MLFYNFYNLQFFSQKDFIGTIICFFTVLINKRKIPQNLFFHTLASTARELNTLIFVIFFYICLYFQNLKLRFLSFLIFLENSINLAKILKSNITFRTFEKKVFFFNKKSRVFFLILLKNLGA